MLKDAYLLVKIGAENDANFCQEIDKKLTKTFGNKLLANLIHYNFDFAAGACVPCVPALVGASFRRKAAGWWNRGRVASHGGAQQNRQT